MWGFSNIDTSNRWVNEIVRAYSVLETSTSVDGGLYGSVLLDEIANMVDMPEGQWQLALAEIELLDVGQLQTHADGQLYLFLNVTPRYC